MLSMSRRRRPTRGPRRTRRERDGIVRRRQGTQSRRRRRAPRGRTAPPAPPGGQPGCTSRCPSGPPARHQQTAVPNVAGPRRKRGDQGLALAAGDPTGDGAQCGEHQQVDLVPVTACRHASLCGCRPISPGGEILRPATPLSGDEDTIDRRPDHPRRLGDAGVHLPRPSPPAARTAWACALCQPPHQHAPGSNPRQFQGNASHLSLLIVTSV